MAIMYREQFEEMGRARRRNPYEGQIATSPGQSYDRYQQQVARQTLLDQLGGSSPTPTPSAPRTPRPTANAPSSSSSSSRFNMGGQVRHLPGIGPAITDTAVGAGAQVGGRLAANALRSQLPSRSLAGVTTGPAGGGSGALGSVGNAGSWVTGPAGIGAGMGIAMGTDYLGGRLKPQEDMPDFGGRHADLIDHYGRRFEGAGPGVAGGMVRGAGYGANPALATATGGLSVLGGALIGGIVGAATKNAPTAFSDFRVEDAAEAIHNAYQKYLGRPATDDEVEGWLRGQGWNPERGDRWVGEAGLNSVLDQIADSPEAQAYRERAALLEQLGGDPTAASATEPTGDLKPGVDLASLPGVINGETGQLGGTFGTGGGGAVTRGPAGAAVAGMVPPGASAVGAALGFGGGHTVQGGGVVHEGGTRVTTPGPDQGVIAGSTAGGATEKLDPTQVGAEPVATSPGESWETYARERGTVPPEDLAGGVSQATPGQPSGPSQLGPFAHQLGSYSPEKVDPNHPEGMTPKMIVIRAQSHIDVNDPQRLEKLLALVQQDLPEARIITDRGGNDLLDLSAYGLGVVDVVKNKAFVEGRSDQQRWGWMTETGYGVPGEASANVIPGSQSGGGGGVSGAGIASAAAQGPWMAAALRDESVLDQIRREIQRLMSGDPDRQALLEQLGVEA